MARLTKRNESENQGVDYKMFTIDNGDEMWLFDITMALWLVRDGRPCETIDVIAHAPLVTTGIRYVDPVYAMSANVDLTKPLLGATLAGECLLVDGHQRLFKALHHGVSHLDVLMLTQWETEPIFWVNPKPFPEYTHEDMQDDYILMLAERGLWIV